MGGYDTAQICLNGHVMTTIFSFPESRKKYCEKCGEPTIIKCTDCETLIKGSPAGVYGATYEVPAYCRSCGKPYPWTKTKIAYAKELAQELEDISQEERDILSESIDDMVADTPRTTLVASRFKRIMSKVGEVAWNEMKTILVDLASETAKKTLFGQ
ncbi:hypothetical protein ES703_116295 [subsurface metagenome]